MRRLATGALLPLLLLVLAAPASAGTLNDDLVNWTETWIEFEEGWTISSFLYDEESDYELTNFDPVLSTDDILAGSAPVGTLFEITIPNFFDPLPTKLVDVHFVGLNSGAQGSELPSVLSIIGADAPFEGPPGPALPVFGSLMDDGVELRDTPDGRDWIEHWELGPNPDFETVLMFVPIGFELQSIHITTQSIPEPSTLALLATGAALLAFRARRRSA